LLGRPVDLDDEGFGPIPGVRDHLARYALTEEALARVESIEFDGAVRKRQAIL
jgi:hypothetical protein